jgi:hypothetical protein
LHNFGQVINGNEIGLADADADIAEVRNITKFDYCNFDDGVDGNHPV